MSLGDNSIGNFIDIRAFITVFGGRLAMGGSHKRPGKPVDLLAVVVEIILTDNLRTVRFQHPCKGIADSSPACPPNMDRPCRVCRNEFKVHSFSCKMAVRAEPGTLLQYLIDDLGGRS